MTSPARFDKDPDAVLDYKMDWSAWLGTDTITTSQWLAPDGINVDSDTHDAKTTTVWVSGGTARTNTYRVTNRIVTNGGRTDDRSIELRVVQR